MKIIHLVSQINSVVGWIDCSCFAHKSDAPLPVLASSEDSESNVDVRRSPEM